LRQPASQAAILRRPNLGIYDLHALGYRAETLSARVLEQVEIEVKYEGYIKRQMADIEKMKKMETRAIPANFDYARLSGLSVEARQKLQRVQPRTLGQASRITGVSPADIATLVRRPRTRPGADLLAPRANCGMEKGGAETTLPLLLVPSTPEAHLQPQGEGKIGSLSPRGRGSG
jgi:hypothetical protein